MSASPDTVDSVKKTDDAAVVTAAAPVASTSASTPAPAPADPGAILRRMRAAHRKAGPPGYELRVKRLDKLEKMLVSNKAAIVKAISSDFGNRSAHETLAAEVFTTLSAIKYARAHLHEWMEPEPREVPFLFMPARAEVIPQPLGVVGVISPWNYPLFLALDPLASILAAGNACMIKPSEFVPETGELMKKMLAETFDEDVVCVVTGGVEIGVAFSKLPFDHLLFTGSTSVGKHIMRAAAENLVPVTLELGGKSPTIVTDGFSLRTAAEKIMHGKMMNAGQTCIAPDYVFVPKGKVDAFVDECKSQVARMYPTLASNPDYTSLVAERHLDRMQGHLDDAEAKGAKLHPVNPANETFARDTKKMAPVLLTGVTEEMTVMQDEIFGPLLPIMEYDTLDQVIEYVNDHPRPLALYVFDNDGARVQRVLKDTISGGVSVNDIMLHAAQEDLPFGGVGPSGMGHYHGREGFETFTKKKPVFYQSRLSGVGMLNPPFGKRIDLILKMLVGK